LYKYQLEIKIENYPIEFYIELKRIGEAIIFKIYNFYGPNHHYEVKMDLPNYIEEDETDTFQPDIKFTIILLKYIKFHGHFYQKSFNKLFINNKIIYIDEI
jgi:hypothetical protein